MEIGTLLPACEYWPKDKAHAPDTAVKGHLIRHIPFPKQTKIAIIETEPAIWRQSTFPTYTIEQIRFRPLISPS